MKLTLCYGLGPLLLLMSHAALSKSQVDSPLTAYEKLSGTLTAKYNRNVIPLKSANDTLEVTFGLAPIHLKLDDEAVLKGRVWLRIIWKDFRLSWNPEEYKGIQTIRLEPSLLWFPDITLYNSYGSNGPMMPYKQRGSYPDAIVGYDGTVSVVPDTHLDAKCEGVDLDDRWAEHHCELRFGSWTYDGEHISLKVHKEHMDLTDFRGINQLQINKNVAGVRVRTYSCCPEPYPYISFNITMQRTWISTGQGKVERNEKLGIPDDSPDANRVVMITEV